MPSMRDFKRLRVWRQSHRLSMAVNTQLGLAPRRGFAHVVRQAQRAASSVPTNIVEGCAHDSAREFARYLRLALGSAQELEYHLIEAVGLSLLEERRFEYLVEEARQVQRQLVSFIERVRADF